MLSLPLSCLYYLLGPSTIPASSVSCLNAHELEARRGLGHIDEINTQRVRGDANPISLRRKHGMGIHSGGKCPLFPSNPPPCLPSLLFIVLFTSSGLTFLQVLPMRFLSSFKFSSAFVI
jgi:hypothetical protein